MVPDFSGYATKAGLKCSDGRTITPDAFKHQDGETVPLVWQHAGKEAKNILGHAKLEHRADGIYCYGFFNDTEQGKNAKRLVVHKDIISLSIMANQLQERAKTVMHGMIREVSLVLSGANPGALIDNVAIQHSDDYVEILEDTAVITTGLELEHEEEETEEDLEHQTAQEVYDSLNSDQLELVHFMIEQALNSKDSAQHSDDQQDDDDAKDSTDEGDLEHKEGTDNVKTRNVFEQKDGETTEGYALTHADIQGIFKSAQSSGSMKAAVEEFALAHGIDDIDLLFPDAKAIDSRPEFDKRRTEWVAGVINGVRPSPFSRIKTLSADITFDEARAKGYIKGTLKKEEFFGLSKRTTSPTTVYKKQKLDRDDILDITDFDVVAWLKGEMRLMLEEEIARAILIGDGRASDDPDKIQDGTVSGIGIRPVATEAELYNTTINFEGDVTDNELIDRIIRNRRFYKGTGTPTFYTTEAVLTRMLLMRDGQGRRLFRTVAELASELRVADVVPVEVMEDDPTLLGVIVNLNDYVMGADAGAKLGMFEDFDIDYNQHKYLIETRVSGALVKIKAALTLRWVAASAVQVTPVEPSFNAVTGVITIPTVANVTYKRGDTNATVTAGALSALAAGASLSIYAVANSGYYFENNETDEWTFTRNS